MHAHPSSTCTNTLNFEQQQQSFLADSVLTTMAFPADSNKAQPVVVASNLAVTNRRQRPDADEDLGSLKPRSHRALYPVIPDLDLNADFRFTSTNVTKDTPTGKPVGVLKKPPPSPPTKARSLSPVRTNSSSTARRGSTQTETSQGLSLSAHISSHHQQEPQRRSSDSSNQTLPSDCSAEDLQAIQAALYEDEVANDEYEEASMALVQQLIREELGLPPGGLAAQAAAAAQAEDSSSHSDSSSSMIAPEAQPETTTEVRPEDTPEARASANTQDLIYQLCLQLDEVNIDVKSENWQVLAPHVIDSLELFCYPTTSNTTSKCDEENQCLVCLTDYEAGEQLRRLPCGHCFHKCCVDPWLLKHDICPICRKTIDEE